MPTLTEIERRLAKLECRTSPRPWGAGLSDAFTPPSAAYMREVLNILRDTNPANQTLRTTTNREEKPNDRQDPPPFAVAV